MYISDGRTVKDVCSLVGISDMTLTHWRRQHPDFDEEYLKSVESQWRSLCKKDWRKDLIKISIKENSWLKEKTY